MLQLVHWEGQVLGRNPPPQPATPRLPCPTSIRALLTASDRSIQWVGGRDTRHRSLWACGPGVPGFTVATADHPTAQQTTPPRRLHCHPTLAPSEVIADCLVGGWGQQSFLLLAWVLHLTQDATQGRALSPCLPPARQRPEPPGLPGPELMWRGSVSPVGL